MHRVELRPSEAAQEAENSIAELARLGSSDVLWRRPLSRASVAELVARTFEERSSGMLVDAAYEATKGNPFLLHELMSEVRAAEVDVRSASGVERIAGLAPRRVSESVLGRAQRIGEDAVRLTRSGCAGRGRPPRRCGCTGGRRPGPR